MKTNEELIAALKAANWNRTEAAKLLGMKVAAVISRVVRLKKLGAKIPDSPVGDGAGKTGAADISRINALIEGKD